jgi:glyoxylase-like metal-dependent hydrolase (beta-lactamase superfamily II)
MRFRVIPVTPFQQNCSLIWCERSGSAAVVDPGGDLPHILAAIEAEAVTVQQILLTHAHIDHAGAVAALARELSLPVIGPHRGDEFWIAGLAEQAQMFGLPATGTFTPERWLGQGDAVTLGKLTLEVRHCPGHTPGHVIFYEPESRLALVGDVLFAGSIGRSDLPGGDFDTLIASIRRELLSLGDEVRFIPGHGPMSSIGHERRSNPFLLAADRGAPPI